MCLYNYKQWVKMIEHWFEDAFLKKLRGTYEVRLVVKGASITRVLSRCLSPHLFIYRNVVKIYVYMWNEFSNELYKIMIKKILSRPHEQGLFL
jgi:hypothetical protein